MEQVSNGELIILCGSIREVICRPCVLLVNNDRAHAEVSSLIEPVNLVVEYGVIEEIS